MNKEEYYAREEEILNDLNRWLRSSQKNYPFPADSEYFGDNMFEKYTLKEFRETIGDDDVVQEDFSFSIKYRDGTIISKMEGDDLNDVKWRNIEGAVVDVAGITTGIYGKVYFFNNFDYDDGEFFWHADVEPIY